MDVDRLMPFYFDPSNPVVTLYPDLDDGPDPSQKKDDSGGRSSAPEKKPQVPDYKPPDAAPPAGS